MPFCVYDTSESVGTAVYRRPQHVALAGRGLIQKACKPFLADHNVPWLVQEADLLRAGNFPPHNHALVIDITPRRRTALLLRVRSVAGFSYAEWTPIMLLCEALFLDEPLESKQAFTVKQPKPDIIRTMLYLRGGYSGGDWNWGGNSRTTAVLLFEEAWDHFKNM